MRTCRVMFTLLPSMVALLLRVAASVSWIFMCGLRAVGLLVWISCCAGESVGPVVGYNRYSRCRAVLPATFLRKSPAKRVHDRQRRSVRSHVVSPRFSLCISCVVPTADHFICCVSGIASVLRIALCSSSFSQIGASYLIGVCCLGRTSGTRLVGLVKGRAHFSLQCLERPLSPGRSSASLGYTAF